MDNKLIVALDVDSFAKAKTLIDRLSPFVNIFKVGSELFTSCGPKIIDYINKKQKKVFLDLKFFDIPNTVRKAILAAARHNVFMLTLHTLGGLDMLKAASSAAKRKPLLLGVTVLTSKTNRNTTKKVIELARIAYRAGLGGIVCSPKETRAVKKIFGRRLFVVNPGIRPSLAGRGDSSLTKEDDQKRVTTPSEAIRNGADYIVVGRPITQATDPVTATKRILREVSGRSCHDPR